MIFFKKSLCKRFCDREIGDKGVDTKFQDKNHQKNKKMKKIRTHKSQKREDESGAWKGTDLKTTPGSSCGLLAPRDGQCVDRPKHSVRSTVRSAPRGRLQNQYLEIKWKTIADSALCIGPDLSCQLILPHVILFKEKNLRYSTRHVSRVFT